MAKPQRDLTRTLLGVLCIGLLIVAALWIVRPFVAAAIWATTIVVVTWPLMLRVQARLWNYRALANASMITVLVLLFVIPLTLAIGAIVANAGAIADQIRSITSMPIPSPPQWVVQLPFIGTALAAAWADASATGFEGLATNLVPYVGGFTAWLFAEIGSAGYLIIQLLLIPVFAAFMYQYGERYASTLLRFAFRLGGKQGEALIILAGQRHPRRCTRRGSDGGRPSSAGRRRPGARRCAVHRASYSRSSGSVPRANWHARRLDPCSHLGFLERRPGMGNVFAGLVDSGQHARHLAPSAASQPQRTICRFC